MNYRNKEQVFKAIKITEEILSSREAWPEWMKQLWEADPSTSPALLLIHAGGDRLSTEIGYSTKPGAPVRKLKAGDYFVRALTIGKDREGNEVDVTLIQSIPAVEFETNYELADEQDEVNTRAFEFRDIRQSREGKWLNAAIAKITTESQTDKTPDEVFHQICELSKQMEEEANKTEGEKPEVEMTEADIKKIHETNPN